jgi:hypothetical protein
MLNVLDVAHLQLYFVSAKKESCLPLYIVPGSHRIDERVPPYSYHVEGLSSRVL